jgi:hypothetical protein
MFIYNPKYNTILEFTNGGVSQVKGGVRSRERQGSVSMVCILHKNSGCSFVYNGKVLIWRICECILLCGESIGLLHNWECLHNNAVSPYFVEIPHFTLVEKLKVFENNVWNVYSAPQKPCIFFILKISYAQIYRMFPQLTMYLFYFFHFFTISQQTGFPGVFAC